MQPLQHQTDEALSALLKEDSEPAFRVLFQRYWHRLLEIAYHKLQSQQEAEDVVQQLFLDIWKNRLHTQLQYTFLTYVSAALKYIIIARVAGQKKRSTVSMNGVLPASLPDHGTMHQLHFNDLRSNLETQVNRLPEKCQLIFRMSREAGKSTREIAAELHISPKTVEAQLTKAIKVLRLALGKHQFFLVSVLAAYLCSKKS